MILKKVKNEIGATAIEYGLIASLISVLAVGGMSAVGINLSNTYCKISKNLGGSGTCSGASTGNANGGGSSGTGGNGSGTGDSSSGNNSGSDGTDGGTTGSAYLTNLNKSLSDYFPGDSVDSSMGGKNSYSDTPLDNTTAFGLLDAIQAFNSQNPDNQITHFFGLYNSVTKQPITSLDQVMKDLNYANNDYSQTGITVGTHKNSDGNTDFNFTTQKGKAYYTSRPYTNIYHEYMPAWPK